MSQTDPTEPITPPASAPTPASAPAAAVPPAQATPPPAATAQEEQLAATRKQAADNYDKLLRALADLDNFRKRAHREKEELRQFAVTGLSQDLLPVIDNLGLGLQAARVQSDVKAVVAGFELVLGQLKSTLAKHGLAEIDPVGQPFDPHKHESISHVPSADVPEEHVVQVVRTGYSLNGRLLRAAAVILSSGAPKTGEAKPTS